MVISNGVNLRIRGIYATALTKFFTDCGFSIIEPSPKISQRLDIEDRLYFSRVEIKDRKDRQSVSLDGEAKQIGLVIEAMRKQFLDMIVRKGSPPSPPGRMGEGKFPLKTLLNYISFEVEFPYISKSALDQLRSAALPTVRDHHKLRTFAKDSVDRAEEELAQLPDRRIEIEERLKGLIYETFKPGKAIKIYHVKPEGEIISLTSGEVIEFDFGKGTVLLKRMFKAGKYDGLGTPKEEGDYAMTEVREGFWVVRHSYYSKEGKQKGELYNINTPAEYYPGNIRYVDLHIDVVRWPDGKTKVIDEEDLEKSVRSGHISKELAEKVKGIAKELRSSVYFC